MLAGRYYKKGEGTRLWECQYIAQIFLKSEIPCYIQLVRDLHKRVDYLLVAICYKVSLTDRAIMRLLYFAKLPQRWAMTAFYIKEIN